MKQKAREPVALSKAAGERRTCFAARFHPSLHYRIMLFCVHNGLLEANAKLAILCELVCHALETGPIRGKLGELIEQREALRGEALVDATNKREEK
ncbi:hypothetical protein V6N13_137901 [Hibiscus sabdariffa]